jgi:hypothetical protein
MFRRRKAWLAEHAGVVMNKGSEIFTDRVVSDWRGALERDLAHQILSSPKKWGEVWDNYGWEAYASDLAKYSKYPSDEARQRESLFRFYYREGEIFCRDSKQALRYAIGRLGYLEKEGRLFDPQLLLDLEEAIERTKRNCSP